MAEQRSWEQIKRDAALDPARVTAYRALLEAERALAALLDEHSADAPRIEDALLAAQTAVGAGEAGLGLYLETLKGHVAALGGRLELRARLPQGEVELPLCLPPRKGAGRP